MKRRGSTGFVRFLIAICIGIAGTLAWQSYGEATKQIIATKAPELGWSPEAKQLIANWVGQLGWTKPTAGPENAVARSAASQTPQTPPIAQTAPSAAPPSAPIAPAIDPGQVHRIALDLGALRQTVEQLAAGQDQMARVITRLEGAVAEILIKIPEPPPPPLPAAAPARKPKLTGLPSSRAPTVPPASRAPLPLH
ncbi:MAG: hypothetical protein WCD69_01870 [Xanthobacteraceae bacterium]